MKKITVVLALVLALLVSMAGVASAAGKLTVVEETFVVLPYGNYHAGYVYAELENTGDKPVEYSGGLLELYDADGNSVESDNPYRCYPNVVNPGEKAYLYAGRGVEEATDKSFIADHLLTVTGKGSKDATITRYPATAQLTEVDSGYWKYIYEVATVKNDTEAVCEEFTAVFVARDAEGKLLHVQSCEPNYVGILPGSTIEIKKAMDRDIMDYFAQNNISIASIDVIVYTTQTK